MGAKGAENRDSILAAANQLFYTKGFSQTSFADIAKVSGIPKGNFYFYYPSKTDLLAAVVDDRLSRLKNLLADWEATIDDPRDRLKRLASLPDTDCEVIARYGCPMGSLSAELGKQRPDMQNRVRDMFDLIIGWAERQFTALGKGGDANELARHLFVRLQGASLLASAYQEPDWINREVAMLHDWIDAA